MHDSSPVIFPYQLTPTQEQLTPTERRNESKVIRDGKKSERERERNLIMRYVIKNLIRRYVIRIMNGLRNII